MGNESSNIPGDSRQVDKEPEKAERLQSSAEKQERKEVLSGYVSHTEQLTANSRKMEAFRKQGVRTSGATDEIGTPSIEGLIKGRAPIHPNKNESKSAIRKHDIDQVLAELEKTAPAGIFNNPLGNAIENVSRSFAKFGAESSKAASDLSKNGESYFGVVGTGHPTHAKYDRLKLSPSEYVKDAGIELASYSTSLVKGLDQIGRSFAPDSIKEILKAGPEFVAEASRYLGTKSITGFNTIQQDLQQTGEGIVAGAKSITQELVDRNTKGPHERGKLPGDLSAAILAGKISSRKEGLQHSELARMPEVPKELSHLELQKAAPELLEAMAKKGREIRIAKPGTEDHRYLSKMKVEGATGGEDMTHIVKGGFSKNRSS